MATKPDLEGNYLLPEYASLRRNAKKVTPSVRADGEEQTEAVAISSLCGGFVLAWRYAGGPRGLRRKSSCTSGFGCRPIFVNILSFRQHTKSEAGLGG